MVAEFHDLFATLHTLLKKESRWPTSRTVVLLPATCVIDPITQLYRSMGGIGSIIGGAASMGSVGDEVRFQQWKTAIPPSTTLVVYLGIHFHNRKARPCFPFLRMRTLTTCVATLWLRSHVTATRAAAISTLLLMSPFQVSSTSTKVVTELDLRYLPNPAPAELRPARSLVNQCLPQLSQKLRTQIGTAMVLGGGNLNSASRKVILQAASLL